MAASDFQKPDVMVICIAVNGYRRLFTREIESQRRYCRAMGYAYCLIDRVGRMPSRDVPWLKPAIALKALENGYSWVLTLDADCEVHDSAPAITTDVDAAGSVFMARGFSGRFNSGVMLFRQCYEAKFFLRTVLANCERSVDGEDWGENGHIAFFARYLRGLRELDRRWNNNTDPNLSDFIRHHCGGTRMGDLWARGLTRRLWSWWVRVRAGSAERAQLKRRLAERVQFCLGQYPLLHRLT